MFALSLAVFFQDLRATQPTYLLPVVLALLSLGGIGWLIAAVLGFARARAFGPSARWFSYAAVCLIIYHLHWVMFGIVVTIGATQTPPDASSGLGIGAFFNLFIVVGAVCAIMGFIRLTNPR
jgi:hypothetical protein